MPEPKSAEIRQRFQRQRRRDTAPELALRRALHRRGLRYRLDLRPVASVRSRADIVFTKARVAVYVDGCFWHGCPEHSTVPVNNREWWLAKVNANRDRDVRTQAALEVAGWVVLRVWEHEDADEAADRVATVVRRRATER